MTPPSDDGPVDLAALRAATAPVVAWYEQLLSGAPMPVADLDVALAGIRALPPVSGRLGRALALVATGGREATSDETLAAFELLRCSAGLRWAPPVPASPPVGAGPGAKSPRRRRRGQWSQPTLPGIDDP